MPQKEGKEDRGHVRARTSRMDCRTGKGLSRNVLCLRESRMAQTLGKSFPFISTCYTKNVLLLSFISRTRELKINSVLLTWLRGILRLLVFVLLCSLNFCSFTYITLLRYDKINKLPK